MGSDYPCVVRIFFRSDKIVSPFFLFIIVVAFVVIITIVVNSVIIVIIVVFVDDGDHVIITRKKSVGEGSFQSCLFFLFVFSTIFLFLFYRPSEFCQCVPTS